jgi:hypothetical protein
MRRATLWACILAAFVACADGTLPARGPDDPADPNAAEAPPAVAAAAAPIASQDPMPGMDHAQHMNDRPRSVAPGASAP